MADIRPLSPPQQPAPIQPFPLDPFTIPDARDIRPRPWLFGYWLMRGAVTLIAAPGGTGKTSLLTAIILSCATGRDLFGVRPLRPMRVAVLGLEEGREEMNRRAAAAVMHYGLPREEIAKNVLFLDGKEHPFRIAGLDQFGQAAPSEDMERLNFSLLGERIDILAVDPFALAHSIPENDNNGMATVISYFTLLGQTCNVAVALFHHTRKGAVAGDPDSIRGAGALVNHARIALGLASMSEDEAKVFNLAQDERRQLVRVDDLKMNYSSKAGDARWIKLESVKLGNLTDDYPHGDSVQVAAKWDPPAAMADLSIEMANQILDEIERGKDGERYSPATQSPRSAQKLILSMMADAGVEKNDAWANSIIKSWLKNDVVRDEKYTSPGQRKERKGLVVNNANRPGTTRT